MDTTLQDLHSFLLVGAMLFAIGLIGFLVRRNMIVMFLCVEMMLQGVSTSLVAWSRFHGDLGGQMLVIFVIAIAACEAGIGLALILALVKYRGNLDIALWHEIREDDQPPFVDQEVPEERDEDRVWPALTPAGIEPAVDLDELTHRSRI